MATPPCNRARTARSLVHALAVLCAVLVASAAYAMHRSTPFLVNLSNFPGGNSTNPGPSRLEPVRDPFESTSDLKHNGSSGQQIFLYTLSASGTDARTLTQITNFAGDSANPTASVLGN